MGELVVLLVVDIVVAGGCGRCAHGVFVAGQHDGCLGQRRPLPMREFFIARRLAQAVLGIDADGRRGGSRLPGASPDLSSPPAAKASTGPHIFVQV